MIFDVFKKEILSNITSPKVVITYAVCTVLIFTAIITGAVNYLSLDDEAKVRASAEKDRLSKLHNYQLDFIVGGMNLYRSPDPLSVLVSGVEGDAALRGNISLYVGDQYDVSKFNATPILAIFGVLDLEFIVKFILSLFAILFTFDAISGEKELGTLKLNFSTSMKRSSFIIGKLLGVFVLVMLPFIVPLLIGLLGLTFVPGIVLGAEEWTRIAFLVLAFMLYLMVFYGLGFMVSSLTKQSSISFLILLMIWVLVISILPRGAVLVAQTVRPVPPLEESRREFYMRFGQEQRGFMTTLEGDVREFFQFIKKAVADPALQPQIAQKQKEFQDNMRTTVDDWTNNMQEIGAQYAREHEMEQNYQNTMAISLSRYTSPAAALSFATQRIARTGVFSSDEQFKESVRGFINTYKEKNKEIMDKNPQMVQGVPNPQPIDVSDIYPEPDFFRHESFEESLSAVAQDYMVLALMSVIFIAIAIVAFMRYDVR